MSTPAYILRIGAALLFAFPALVMATEARVPVYLDYGLVRSLLVAQLFVGPGERAEVVDDGCSTVWLTDPLLASEGEALRIEARVEARMGMLALGTCQQVLSWEGRVGVLGIPRVQDDGRRVKFEPTRTWLEEPGGARLDSGPVWELLDTGVRSYLQRFTLDFSPQIESLQQALTSVAAEPITIHAAGRTDAGVHALANVAHVDLSRDWEEDELLRALRALDGIEWSKVTIFHMDEYIDLPDGHPASFPTFLRRHLLAHIPAPAAFYPVLSHPGNIEAD